MWETVDDPKFYAERLSAVKVRRLWHWVERAMTGRYRYSLRCAFVTLVVSRFHEPAAPMLRDHMFAVAPPILLA